MLDQLPQEVFQQLIQPLPPTDLKALRLVNKAFSRDVCRALYRKIDVSCLTIDNLESMADHPQIAPWVQELHYHEMRFDNVTSQGYSRRTHDNDTSARFFNIMQEFTMRCSKVWYHEDLDGGTRPVSSVLDEFLARDFGVPGFYEAMDDEDEVGLVRADKKLIAGLLACYEDHATTQKLWPLSPRCLSQIFRRTLPLLPQLKRIITFDGGAGEILGDYPGMDRDPSLRIFHYSFPLSDAIFRNSFQNYSTSSPGHGFIAFWIALNSTDSAMPKIRHLETYRDPDSWVKQGISLDSFNETIMEQMPDFWAPPTDPTAFQYLETLVLCLHAENDDEPINFMRPLANARNLKRLELSKDTPLSPAGDYVSFYKIVPLTSYPNLETIGFENFGFLADELSEWLFIQPRLKNLVLRHPRLMGYWKNVLDLWHENKAFRLTSIEITSPWDLEHADHFGEDQDEHEVPSRVSSEDILHYINKGGTNPFAARRWLKFARTEDQVIEDNLSDYSDMSEWKPNEEDDFEDPHGPEYYEDYDFDAEYDSDFDIDQQGDVVMFGV